MRPYRDILKHGATYGVGQLLGRLASVVLLPLYTRYLVPADYGVIAILDLLAGLLAIVIGSGMASAVNRFHFDVESDDDRRAVWWTGLAFVTGASTVIALPLWFARDGLAYLALGADVERGGLLVGLALATLWVNSVGQLPETYLRVRKWSGLVVVLSLGRLLLNVGLNVWFLVGLGWGVEGVLWGNLLTGIVAATTFTAIQVASTRPYAFDTTLLKRLLAFGAPLIVTALLGLVLHDADRYLLRVLSGRDAVGVYSVAYKIGQSVATLLLTPFAAIWAVSIYEIAALEDGRRVFARVYARYVQAVALVMLAASLFARPILSFLVAESYAGAADLVPVICLAYLFFSLHQHFQVPVMLAKRTGLLVPVFALAAVVNVGANLALIPRLGPAGAAWASVLGFAAYSFVGLLVYRRLDRIAYPHAESAAVVAGMIATYLGCRVLPITDPLATAGVSALVCGGWCLALFGRDVRTLLRSRRSTAPSVPDDGATASITPASVCSGSQENELLPQTSERRS